MKKKSKGLNTTQQSPKSLNTTEQSSKVYVCKFDTAVNSPELMGHCNMNRIKQFFNYEPNLHASKYFTILSLGNSINLPSESLLVAVSKYPNLIGSKEFLDSLDQLD